MLVEALERIDQLPVFLRPNAQYRDRKTDSVERHIVLPHELKYATSFAASPSHQRFHDRLCRSRRPIPSSRRYIRWAHRTRRRTLCLRASPSPISSGTGTPHSTSRVMPRSCRPSSSHLLAMEVTSTGQSVFACDPFAQLRHELRLLEKEMRGIAHFDIARAGNGGTRIDEIGGIEHARAVLALVAARVGHSRNADRCRSHSGPAETACPRSNRPACVVRSSRWPFFHKARAKCCVNSWFCRLEERPK